MEEYFTIQGEGYNTGSAAYFIRLGGCDVECTWCDVKESWNKDKHPLVHINTITKNVIHSKANKAIITGGEPLLYDLDPLCKNLHSKNIELLLETSAAYPLSGEWDWICVSPKKFKAPIETILSKANELKIIIYNKSDFAWAKSFQEKVKPSCKLYLQPEWSKQQVVLPLIIEYVKNNPEWKISLQTHKFMNIP